MKKLKTVLLTVLLCGLSLLGKAQIDTTQSRALIEYVKQNNLAIISSNLLKVGTLLPDSIINSSSFKTMKYVAIPNGHHLLFIKRITANFINYYAMVYDMAYQPTDLKEYSYSCNQCLATDTITRLWVTEDKTKQDFYIEYYRNNSPHMPLYTISGP